MKLENPTMEMLIGAEGTEIRITDEKSGVSFVQVKLNPEQPSRLFARQACVKCEVEVRNLELVGKQLENDMLEFEIPSGTTRYNGLEQIVKLSKDACPEGWTPDEYFGSQNSFFTKGGKSFARCAISRWV